MQYEVRWPDGRSLGVDADALMDAEWTPQGPCAWDVRLGARNYRVLLLEGPDASGNLTLRVDGVRWSGCVADDRKLLLERMGMGVDEVVQDRELIAPMPGKVLAVSVAAGDSVEEGEPLLILEAMKMENVLKSPRAGTVQRVEVESGTAVEKGAVLVTFADEM